MPISVQPLVINYSFAANARQATDRVDLAQLDTALASVAAKLNEVVTAINVTTRDDDTLHDHVVEPRHLAPEVYSELASMVQKAVCA
jgi:hypothetical protein